MATTTAENPLRAGLRIHKTPDPCSVVIFGATGDLAHRKLIPSLYNLAVDQLLPHNFAIVGFSRPAIDHADFRRDMQQAVSTHSRYAPVEPHVWDSFAQAMYFQQADFGDLECYRRLGECLDKA